jgi:hypothetical protein
MAALDLLLLAKTHSSDHSLSVAVIGAVATVSVALVGGLAAYFSSKRDRRRQLYGEAVRAAMAWQELLYRVRRRAEDESRELVHRFHEAQDQLTYFQAWMASDSKYMSRSYDRLVKDVKAETIGLIREAWQAPVRAIPGDAQPGDRHPDLDAARQRFMTDVRSHLSPLPWRRAAMAWRNRESANGG